MDYHVTEAQYVSGYVVRLKFRDGTEGEIDLKPELTGPMFEPLRDIELFQRFRVDAEFHTLVWPNGADFAPEFLHDNVRVTA
ncbi:MAG: DUF2442 domain-containing protein [Nitrospira sp.]|nr:DUF2442 domain-containing protein [Nitrospira sp.]